jgi:hypothetical protein
LCHLVCLPAPTPLKAKIDAGQALPPRYKAVLFHQPHEAELIWPGKTHEVTNVVLPFQSIEQIDEPRAADATAYNGKRRFQALLVPQEGWEAHKFSNFGQLVAAFA